MHVYGTILLATFVAAWLLTPLARRVALRFDIVDHPGVRKVHETATPYLGGAAIFATLVLGLITLLILSRDPEASFAKLDNRMLVLVGGAAVMFGLGLWDDIENVRARHKLAIQLAVATLIYAVGIRIEGLRITDSITLEFGVFSYFITVLWIAGVTNAINLIDGLDGLAAGIASISCAAIGYVAYSNGNYPAAAMMAALLGSLLGFLPHNHRPARIFLGDSGSLLIGYLLATSALFVNTKSAAFVSVAVPFLALGIPLLDMVFAMLRRFIERRGLFSPDRSHIHHRLVDLGYGRNRTVYILWVESAAVTTLALVLLETGAPNSIKLPLIAGLLLLHVIFFRAFGAVRLKESWRAFKAAAARAADAGKQRRDHDELELRFRECATIDQWWTAVSDAAERLGMTSLALQRAGDAVPAQLTWASTNATSAQWSSVTVPVLDQRGGQARLEIGCSSNDNLESLGKRISTLGRLLDQHRPVALNAPTRDPQLITARSARPTSPSRAKRSAS